MSLDADPTLARNVDLKWSLWAAHRETWEDYAPGLWDWLKAAGGVGEVVIRTAPRREIRFGVVRFHGEGQATVSFKAVWDSVGDLLDQAPGYETATEAEIERMHDALSDWFQGDFMLDADGDTIGAEITEAEVRAESFEDLMAAIDQVEVALLEQEKEHDAALQEFLKDLLAYVRGEVEE